MDNPEKLATLGTQNTTTEKTKRWATQTQPKTWGEPRCSRWVSTEN
jgi:hypothetical protein